MISQLMDELHWDNSLELIKKSLPNGLWFKTDASDLGMTAGIVLSLVRESNFHEKPQKAYECRNVSVEEMNRIVQENLDKAHHYLSDRLLCDDNWNKGDKYYEMLRKENDIQVILKEYQELGRIEL